MFAIWFPYLVSMKTTKVNQTRMNIEESIWFPHLVSRESKIGGNQMDGNQRQTRMNRSGCLVSYLVSAVSGFLPFCPVGAKGNHTTRSHADRSHIERLSDQRAVALQEARMCEEYRWQG
jgi:hypothetical protein